MDVSAGQDSRSDVFAPWIGIPLLVMFGGTVFAVACGMVFQSPGMALTGIFLYLIGLVYLSVQTLGRLILRQWQAALCAGLRLALCLIPACIIAMSVLWFARAFQSEDGFATDLTIPADMGTTAPLPRPTKGPGSTEDHFQQALWNAWSVEPTSDPFVVPSMPSLRTLASQHRSLLLQYLTASPAWRVFEQDGVLCATRRWRLGQMWLWKMHGYYSTRDVRPCPNFDMPSFMRARMKVIEAGKSPDGSSVGGVTMVPPSFQTRTTIGLDGKPWASSEWNETWLDEGTSAHSIQMDKRWALDSHIIIRCGPVVTELFEQAKGPERRLTKAALRALEAEFKALLDRKESMHALLPKDSIRRGEPVLNLHEGMQPGIYEVEIWINPGEAGTVCLKAFEVTRGTPLSTRSLREYSHEKTGWSEDPNELFYSNTNVTIYEGDWGDPYAARFELWFVPDSGQTESKLLERIFKIEGWQR